MKFASQFNSYYFKPRIRISFEIEIADVSEILLPFVDCDTIGLAPSPVVFYSPKYRSKKFDLNGNFRLYLILLGKIKIIRIKANYVRKHRVFGEMIAHNLHAVCAFS